MQKSIILGLVIVCVAWVSPNAFAADYAAIKGERPGVGVQVVQNRFFIKKLRPEIGFFAGTFLNEAFTDTNSTGARINLFITEWLGIEAQRLTTDIKDSQDLKALQEIEFRDKVDQNLLVRAEPDINRIHGATDIGIVVVPFYGKLNLFDQLIIYSDLYVSASATKIDSDQGDINGYALAGGQRFFIGKSASIQFDIRNRSYKEKRGETSTNKNALSLDVGASYFFF